MERYNLVKMCRANDTYFAHVVLGSDVDKLHVPALASEWNCSDVQVEVKLNGFSVRVENFESLVTEYVNRRIEQRKGEIVGVTQYDIDNLVKEQLQSLIDCI